MRVDIFLRVNARAHERDASSRASRRRVVMMMMMMMTTVMVTTRVRWGMDVEGNASTVTWASNEDE